MTGWISGPVTVTPFPERLKQLVAEHGTSISRLYDDVQWTGDGDKPSKAQLDKSMRGALPVRRETMEMLARHLGLDPAETFVEYRLALARDALDERVVGLQAAAEMLEAIEAATQSEAAASAPRAAPQPPASDRRRAASARARRRARGS